jgi:hypothetical protein
VGAERGGGHRPAAAGQVDVGGDAERELPAGQGADLLDETD